MHQRSPRKDLARSTVEKSSVPSPHFVRESEESEESKGAEGCEPSGCLGKGKTAPRGIWHDANIIPVGMNEGPSGPGYSRLGRVDYDPQTESGCSKAGDKCQGPEANVLHSASRGCHILSDSSVVLDTLVDDEP